MKNNLSYHTPVLLTESVEALNIKPSGVYVDVTFGGGGHSGAILEKLDEEGKLIVFDKDEEALQNAPRDSRLVTVHSDYRYLKNQLKFLGINQIDGLLADLGISSHQIDTPGRGFSIRYDAPLDMRMDQNADLTAYQVVNDYDEESLAAVLFEYGELKNARSLAKSIVKFRKNKPVRTTFDLIEAVKKHIPAKFENKFLAKIFQALRIEVNGELESLKRMLFQSKDLIKPGGRLAVITYHSLEDRLVKRFIQTGNFEGELHRDFYGNYSKPFRKIGKFIVPSKEEIARNPRARSAKLRVAERLSEK